MAAVRSQRRVLWSRFLIGCATAGFVVGALSAVLGRNLFRAESFGDRAAASLDDPRVAAFVADRIANVVVQQSPDLIAARPILLATAEGLVSSPPFRALVRVAARRAHQALFSEESRRVVLAMPDVEVLIRGALEQASPQMAAKVPERLHTVLASADIGARLQAVVGAWRLGRGVRGSAAAFIFLVAPLLLVLGLWVAHDRKRALFRAGMALLVAGFATALFLPIGRLAAAVFIEDPLVRGAVQGLWRTFMIGLFSWGLFFGGIGVLFTAAGTSLLDAGYLERTGREATRAVFVPPAKRGRRIAWGSAWLAVGVFAILFPGEIVTALVVAAGVLAAFGGVRELFRLVLESAPAMPALAGTPKRRWTVRGGLAFVALLALVGAWVVFRLPEANPVQASVGACNGSPALCDKRVDEVVFAGAHNAMSNAQISDWMFPNQEMAIPQQLRDGIRALLIDVHYGFPGGARIKSDLEGNRPPREMLEEALGKEGVEAALRMREQLVGADEGRRGLYLCHGFCELGGYELLPVLRSIRDFLVQNPEEVLIIVVENYVTPEDLSAAFQESGLAELVYTGSAPPWPTLRELIAAGQRVIAYVETGGGVVPWLRATIENIQETPYTFYKPEEFSCKPHRGGTKGSLFQINHWIQTTPNPQPSNAAVVNEYDFLLKRCQNCARERKHVPNIVAVDFYRTGDVFRVVDALNGVAEAPDVP